MIKIIDMYAKWCYPCKIIAPIVEKVAKDMNVELIKVDIDENPVLVAQYNVKSVPTIIIDKDGTECGRLMGVTNKTEQELKEIISKNKE